MRALAILAGLLLVPVVAAQGAPSTGLYVGAVSEGQTDVLFYSTHGDTNCLGIYIAHTYTVTLVTDPGATLSVAVGAKTATSSNGVATLSFTANYCTQFHLYVHGVAVTDTASYVLNVEHVIKGPAIS